VARLNAASTLPIVFEDVEYAVGRERLLGPLRFEVAAGSRTVILGPNGAGKSLTLRLAHALIAPTRGRVAFGTPRAQALPRQAMVFQRPVLLRRSTRANVEYALALRGVGRSERRSRSDAVLERAGLLEFAERPARALSGGEQQRLVLTRAWALEPEVLFLDEPSASLDPAATRRIEEIVAQVAAEGTKIVMTTHDLGQARRLADEIFFLHRGKLCEHARAEVFFREPATREARAFLAGELLW